MAATDQHYRDQKTLDLVFGVSCGLMLVATLWMLVQDFNRDFKNVQRTFRDVEATIAERDMVDKLPDTALVDAGLHAVRLARIEVKLAKAEAVGQKLPELHKKFEEFKAFKLSELDKDNRDKLDRRLTALEADPALATADAAFLAAERKIQGQRDSADETYRGFKAAFDAQTSYYNIAIDDAGKEPETGGRKQALLSEADRIKKKIEDLQAKLDIWKGKLDALDSDTRRLREPVAGAEKGLADNEDALKKVNATFDRYAKLAAQKSWGVGDSIRALPILDGFASPVKINQIYLPELTIDYGGFRDVPRYDRCMTCHLGIDRGTFEKAMLGKLGDEDESKRLTAKLQSARDQLEKRVASGEKLGYSPSELPGERQGNLSLITILMLLSSLVAAVSLAALERSWRVGLNTLFAGLALTLLTAGTLALFAPMVPKVKAIKLTPGQMTQYCSHPRLDLFVDSNSPHPAEKFGCTTCHAGQGSATDFTLANHMPNDSHQEHQWKKGYGWASSHYWDFPMLPKRFTESSCIKCHHQVTDLITKGNKQEAPKVTRGYEIIRDMGCFGCHEIQGQKSGRPVGPDMRLESAPAMEWLSATEQERMKADPANPPGTLRKVGPSLRRLAEKVSEEWTRKWVLDPRGFREDTKMPHFYGLSTNSPEALKGTGQEKFPQAEIAAISHYLIAESKNSLEGADFYREGLLARNGVVALQTKLSKEGLSDKEMKDLLDTSKRFSDLALLSNPLAGRLINDLALRQRQLQERLLEIQRRVSAARARTEEAKLKSALEEIAAPSKELVETTTALIASAKPIKVGERLLDGEGNPTTLPADGKGDAAKGRLLFTEKGCLACHAHEGTTKALKQDGKTVVYSAASDANFGPELSRLVEKLAPSVDKTSARLWLVQWILNPGVYHPRTRMPVTHLNADQANDIATWLLAHKPSEPSAVKDPGQAELKDLVDLARVYLAKAPGMTRADLDSFLPAGDKLPGIPEERTRSMPRDADELVLKAGTISPTSLKWYVGKKAINRLGCYACHDMPGFETAKPIGVGLNDWGRKSNDRIAFEDGAAFVEHHFNIVASREGPTRAQVETRLKELEEKKDAISPTESVELEALRKRMKAQERIHELEEKAHKGTISQPEADELHKLEPQKFFETSHGKPPFEQMFFHLLEHHQREGFLHLKLAEPRSYDYNRLRSWDDRLRMPQFKFARTRKAKGETDEAFKARSDKEEAEAREAVMTFVLGLVAEPTPLKYIHTPKPERAAEVAGRQVLDKYNCGGCHQIRPGVFEFKMNPANQKSLYDSFYKAALDPDNQSSWLKDHVYQGHNAWFGAAPTSDLLTAYGYIDKAESEKRTDGQDVIGLVEALRFAGPDRAMHDLRAGLYINLPRDAYTAHAPYGGTWTELMLPYLSRKDPTNFPAAEPGKSRGVLPPPLVRQGERVQPDWLYKFLLNPGVVRPESYMLLRMPKFNMSPEEARTLVNYFAAVSNQSNPGAGVTFPYVAIDQRDPEYWKLVDQKYRATTKARLAEVEAALKDPKNKAKEAELKKIVDALKAAETAKGPGTGYTRAAFGLLTHKDLCITCHNIGSVTGKDAPKGPNLALAADRLRPGWAEHWIANPRRMFTYSPLMPQNFPNATSPLEWQYQDLFAGTPLEQTRAVRDLIMDSARLNELTPTYKAPPPTPTGDKK